MAGMQLPLGQTRSTDLAHARELIAEVVPDARWREMIGRMAEIAEGDGPIAVEAARVLMACAFGIPG